MRDSFIFYRSFYEALCDLDDQSQLKIYQAIASYSLDFKEPELTGVESTIFKLIKPNLEANNKRYMNGKQPKTKQNGSKNEAKTKQPKSKAEANKDKDKDKDKDEDKEIIVTASMKEADDVALHLANRILEFKEDAKVNPKAWVKDIELAIRIDGRSKDALIRCIDWIYHGGGSFWIPNIKSGKKLREQYDTMDMQARRPSVKKTDEMQERLARLVHTGGHYDAI